MFFHDRIGVVYNITPFMKYHPGGKAQLMRGAGNDCTQLFDKVSMIQWIRIPQAVLEEWGWAVWTFAFSPNSLKCYSSSHFLFQIHIWVNSESILQKCIIGVYTGAPATSSGKFNVQCNNRKFQCYFWLLSVNTTTVTL